MKILLTGANGLLGSYLVPELGRHGHEVMATGIGPCRLQIQPEWGNIVYRTLDITDPGQVTREMESFCPQVIIHAAAHTQADFCEIHQVACWDVNVTATRFIIEAARKLNAFMVYVSTDFVFDGKAGPYKESDTPAPVNYYGCTKRVAEKAVMASGLDWSIARTVLVYGKTDSVARTTIISWVAEKLNKGEKIKVVSDQYRTPTYAGDLATGLRLIAEKKITGIFHLSGKELMTPFDMALKTADFLGLDKSLVEKVDASVFAQPAIRPLKTGFVIDKAINELGYDPLTFSEGLGLVLDKK